MKAKQLMSLLLVGSALALASCDPATTTSSSPSSPSDTGNSQTSPVDTGSSSSSSEEQSTPEPSVDYSISQIVAKDQTYTVRGVVDAKTTKGFVITDGTASVYVYLNAEPSAYSIGDYLEVTGKTGAFNGMFQFTAEAKIAKLNETPSYTIPEPKTLTAADLDKWSKATSFAVTDMKEYKWQATAGKDGNYYTLNLAGSEVTVEPSYKPNEFTVEEGATYDVTAYFAGYAGVEFGDYAAVYLTSLTKTGEGGDTPVDPEPSDDYAISQISTAGAYTVRGVIDAITTEGFVVTDGTAAVYYHDKFYSTSDYASDVKLGAAVELSGEVSAYNGLFQYDFNDTIQFLDTDLDVTIPAATPLTAEIANSWNATSHPVTAMKEYSWTATAGNSGNFLTLNLATSSITIEPTYIPDSFNVEEGATYEVTAYFAGYSTQYKYAGVYLTSLTKTGEGGDTPVDPEPSDDYSIGQITATGNYTIRGVVDAMTTAGCVISDGANAIYYHDFDVADLVSLGDYIEITGNVEKYHGMFQFPYGSNITVLAEKPSITMPAPTPLTADIVKGWTTDTDYEIDAYKEYTWTSIAGTTTSGGQTYYTLNIDGSDTLIEPAYLSSSFSITSGATYNVTAYFGGYSTNSKYVAVYLTNLVAAD